MFDPAAFLDLPVEAPLEKRPPLPVGDYTATIKDVVARQWASKTKTNQDGSFRSGIAYDVTFTVEVPEAVAAVVGLSITTLELRDGIMLELTDNGSIDTSPGKNRGLRNYREALDMNKAGEPFRARDMIGRLIRIKIAHEEYPQGSGQLTERVGGVARIG
jgi:hypothetical protein